MTPSITQPYAALTAAAQRLKDAFRASLLASRDALSVATMPVADGTALADVRVAMFDLDRKQSALLAAFDQCFDEAIDAEWRRRKTTGRTSAQATAFATSWEALSLVDDAQVERQVAADRLGELVRSGCEVELRLLDTFIGGLLPPSDRPDADRNPLRPDVLAKALVAGVEAITANPDVHKILVTQGARNLRSALPATYRDIADTLRAAGVEPLAMTVRNVQSSGGGEGYDSRAQALGDGSSGWQGSTSMGSAHGALASTVSPTGFGAGGGAGSGTSRGTAMGQVNFEVMTLIKRLASIGNLSATEGFQLGAAAAPLTNLIATHREELRSATSNGLDHMVIDVVGSLFDQILADPKVPPQMARHIARLQLPVLRAALGDATFFSSRRHPVRRFVNRIASLSVAFDDFNEGGAKRFLLLVRELVDEIVSGDFEQIEVYEEKLDRLEAYIAEQAQRDAEPADSPGAVLNQRERDLVVQQRYMQHLNTALLQVPMDDFLRQFLTQVWPQAIIHAHSTLGENADLTQRFRAVGRDLILSVQPKGTPVERKRFLMMLPQLMKDLNEGLALIGWPEEAKKGFMSRLLPAHSDSLKLKSMSVLDFNLLAKQLDAVMATQVPRISEIPITTPSVDAIAPRFTPDEARRIGLVQEQSVDWDGTVDIDLGNESEGEVDIAIDIEGLPATQEPAEPTHGASLAQHVQIGFSYRMFFENAWHKVRLSHISPGRTFFVFTRGKDHGEAISMTARMLYRMCEAGRLRAYENAYLIERATARARRQLAALGGGAASGAKTIN